MKSYVAYIFLGGPKNDRFRINIYDNRYYQDYLQDVSYSETYKCLLQKDISSIDGKILVENFNFKQSSLVVSFGDKLFGAKASMDSYQKVVSEAKDEFVKISSHWQAGFVQLVS